MRRVLMPPVETVIHDDGPRNVCRAVAFVPGICVAEQAVIHNMAEHLWAPGHLALDRPGVGIQQQLVGVVAQARVGLPRAVRPHPVPSPGTEPNHVPWARFPRATLRSLSPVVSPGSNRQMSTPSARPA